MRLALVADPDVKERMRATRVIAGQTTLSAIGAATWEEVVQALEGSPRVELILYAPPLPGEPPDALRWLDAHTKRLFVSGAVDVPGHVTQVARPITEEALVLLARAAGGSSTTHKVSFAPVDFLQMVVMSGASHTLVISDASADVGIIEVREGRVWTAFDALGVGEDAFARLIRPEMRCRVSPTTSTTKARSIEKDLAELVLDALRRLDEGSIAAPPPLSRRRIEVALATPDQIAARAKEKSAEARKLLMERRYDEAARALVELSELDPSSPLVRANLEQLRKLGYPT